MARTEIRGDITQRLLSPPCEVQWGPWKSNTAQMARAGWEFAAELDNYRQEYRILMRDRQTGMSGAGRALVHELVPAAGRYDLRSMGVWNKTDPVIFVHSMGISDRYTVMVEPGTRFMRIDMMPSVITGTVPEILSKTIDELGVFKRWAPKADEIVVEPATVAEMLEKIKRMQSADLAAIRERNRKRELRDQQGSEQVVAQIITLAA